MNPMLWHYTYGIAFRKIIADGKLKTTSLGVDPGERPALWFSSNQLWERTAHKGGCVGMADTHRQYGGLYRFGVDPANAPHGWEAHVSGSGVTGRTAARLAAAGESVGANPAEWFVSYDPVGRDKWVQVERWTGAAWVRADALDMLGIIGLPDTGGPAQPRPLSIPGVEMKPVGGSSPWDLLESWKRRNYLPV
jgi:hypothetical protein